MEKEELLLTIKKEVEARETSEKVKTSENDRKPSTGKPPIPTASALFAKQNGGKNIPRCVYCKELHYSTYPLIRTYFFRFSLNGFLCKWCLVEF